MNRMVGHVKWFVEKPPEILSGTLSSTEFILIFTIFCFGLLVLFALQHILESTGWSHRITQKLSGVRAYLPEIVRISTGLLLIVNGVSRYLYAPNITADTTIENITLLALVVIGVMMLVGFFTHVAALGLISLYLLSLFFISPIPLLEHIEYLGLGLFVLFTGCGMHGIDRRFHLTTMSWCKRYDRWAYPSLRVATGLGLIILALTEKLLNVNLASEFLMSHPWNLFESIGVSDRIFIIFSGTVELLIGVSFVLNLAARMTAIFLLGLFATTAILLGPLEIIGHLFAVPVVTAILIYGHDMINVESESASRD